MLYQCALLPDNLFWLCNNCNVSENEGRQRYVRLEKAFVFVQACKQVILKQTKKDILHSITHTSPELTEAFIHYLIELTSGPCIT